MVCKMYKYTMYILIYHSLCPIFAIFIIKWSEIFTCLIIILGDPLDSPEFCIFISKG